MSALSELINTHRLIVYLEPSGEKRWHEFMACWTPPEDWKCWRSRAPLPDQQSSPHWLNMLHIFYFKRLPKPYMLSMGKSRFRFQAFLFRIFPVTPHIGFIYWNLLTFNISFCFLLEEWIVLPDQTLLLSGRSKFFHQVSMLSIFLATYRVSQKSD